MGTYTELLKLDKTKKKKPKTVRAERPERTERPERGVRDDDKRREIKRYSFEFFRDQPARLQGLKIRSMKQGKLKSMSSMVREAVDEYLEKEENRTGRTERTSRSGRTQKRPT